MGATFHYLTCIKLLIEFRLVNDSRVALVTGASQGLGLALAAGLAERMEPTDVVYLTSRDPVRCAEAAAGVAPGRAQLRTEALDVADPWAVDRVATQVAERHGGVDIVFSNAYRRVQPSDRGVRRRRCCRGTRALPGLLAAAGC